MDSGDDDAPVAVPPELLEASRRAAAAAQRVAAAEAAGEGRSPSPDEDEDEDGSGAFESARRWTKEEDELLVQAVKTFKGKNWKRVAELFEGRTDVQCLHRWQKVLNPELVKGPWTKEVRVAWPGEERGARAETGRRRKSREERKADERYEAEGKGERGT